MIRPISAIPSLAFRAENPSGALRRVRLYVACLVVVLTALSATVDAAPVPVRHTEGMVRGFLVLTDLKGTRLASGDFLQSSGDGEINTRTLLNFNDGSLHDETSVFTQQRNFVLKSYRLVQKGPAFREDIEATLETGSGRYQVKVTPRGGREKLLNGKLALPPDVYNGIVPTVAKNLKGEREAIHVVAFTPTPRVVQLDMIPSGTESFYIGDSKRSAVHYVLKPKLGMLKVPAKLMGKMPPDNHLWILTSDIPAFIKFQGPLANEGPIWRIELTSPVWRE